MGFGIGKVFKGAKKAVKKGFDLGNPFGKGGEIVASVPGAIVGGTVGQLIPKPPKQPTLPEAQVMPNQDEEEVRRARRRALARQYARRGRASTILTNQETLG